VDDEVKTMKFGIAQKLLLLFIACHLEHTVQAQSKSIN